MTQHVNFAGGLVLIVDILLFVGLAAAQSTPTASSAPAPPNAIEELSKQKLTILRDAAGGYSGAGWDRLMLDASAAQFFMIGEQHGTADIAEFGIAAHKHLARHGYSHAAYEIGPYSTEVVERIIRSGPGRLASYIRKPGKAIALPFLFYQEEVDLAEQIVAASPDKQNALWGLDQEFIGSGPIVAELLTDWGRTTRERDAARAFSEKLKSSPMILGERPWSEMQPLEVAFASNGRAKQLLMDLRLSNEIYAPFTGRGGSGYEANLLRENYMKQNFARHFARAEKRNGKPPKVFLKFGGHHAQKGFTGTNVPGLGNFLYEWGLPRRHAVVNIMVDCQGGETRNPLTNAAAPCVPYFDKESVLAKLPKPDKLTLVDLRPLRKQLRRMTGLDEQTRQIILSFDYYLTIKDVKAAAPTVAPQTG